MKKMKVGVAVILAVAAVASMRASNVFAANSYGINYSGGAELKGGVNVQINPNLINGLTPLVKYGGSESNVVNFSGPSNAWTEGYIKTSVCHKVSYSKIIPGSDFAEGLAYSISKNPYSINVGLSKVEVDGFSLDSGYDFVPIAISHINGGLYVGPQIYSDNTCSNEVAKAEELPANGSKGKIFVETNIKIYEDSKSLISDGLYFGITDVDAGQSYKILNEDNYLTQSNMYAKDSRTLQPEDSDLKNMYNSAGKYIYSQPAFNIDSGSDIFVSVNETVLKSNGLRVVFGFTAPAGSGVEYYAKQFVVKYVSDNNGSITGTKEEDIISGRNPLGSSSKPKDDFKFAYWRADVDVTLKDGTIIKAGNKLTSEQVKQVVVERDITFTAIHEESVLAPDTGEFTSTESLAPVVFSVFGIAALALIVGLLPRLTRKKIKFD